MNIATMSPNFVSTIFSSVGSRNSSPMFDASLYTDIRGMKVSTLRNFYKQMDPEYGTKPNKPTNGKDTANSFAAAELKSDAGALKASSGIFTTLGSDSIFKKYTATSSDKNSIEKAYIEGALPTSKMEIKVDVDQTALSQKNTGAILNSSEMNVAAGSYSFEVDVNGKKTTLNFSVSAKDTNLSMQQKLADTINKADLGLTAKVNTSGKQSFLSVESDNTGTGTLDGKNVFSFSDKYGGSLVSNLDLNRTTQNAQDAIYRVNGGTTRTSKSNTVDLGGNAKAVLKDMSNGEVTLKFQNDRSSITKAVETFIDDFNSLLKTSSYYGSNSKSIEDVSKSLSNLTQANSLALKSIGISVDYKGGLTLNKDTFASADMDKIKNIFSGSGSFVDNVNKKSSNIYQNANRYAVESFSYYGNSKSPYSSSFSGGLYNNWF